MLRKEDLLTNFCDVIQNGDLLEEREDPNDLDFMPSSRAKHRAPRNMDVGIQEKPKKKPAVSTTWKCSTVKEGGPLSLITSPFPPYGGNLQQIHT